MVKVASVNRLTHHVDNVFPQSTKVPAVSIAPDFATLVQLVDNPEMVVLHEASGGFNSVIEIAARYCLREFALAIGPLREFVEIPGSQLQDYLSGQETPFESDELQTLEVDSGRWYALALDFVPRDLSFQEGKKVCVKYRATLDLLVECSDLRIPPDLEDRFGKFLGVPSFEVPGWGPNPPTPFSSGTIPSRETPVQPAPKTEFQMARAEGMTMAVDLTRRTFSHFRVIQPSEPRLYRRETSLGTVDIDICAPWAHLLYANVARVDVFADLTRSEVEIHVEEGDTQRLYDHFLATREASLIAGIVLHAQVHICPTLSLMGANPSNVIVSELPDIDVSSFHVASGSRQALTVAFDLKPGCHGIIEDVQYFIGARDYGVLSDECVIEALCKHKWRLGGFDRSLRVTRTIRIARNGNEEDATLRGRLVLDTLDFVTVDTDADTRSDYIRLGGRGRGVPDDILLSDGTVIGPDQVDFGDPTNTPWSVFTIPSVLPHWSSDPEIRQFQQRAHYDAYRFLARPYARNVASASLKYSRLEGVTKFFFVLGDLPVVFI